MSVLSQSLFLLSPDRASWERVVALVNDATAVMAAYESAMARSVALVQKRAVENAPRVSGTLARGIRGQVDSIFEGRVGVIDTIPYATRREFGFDNQTDSLGRYYPLDPKDPAKRANMHYLERALISAQPDILAIYSGAMTLALHRLVL
jgi:hypothetical protein